jgi:sugar/nucleoside kinase (ribokinase family)
MPHDVVGVGANAVDRLLFLPDWPAAEGSRSKLRILRQEIACGGQTATALCACARLGLRTSYVGAIGGDDNGRRVRAELLARGVDLTHAVSRPVPNIAAVILINQRVGERIVLWERDERLTLAEHELPARVLQSARVVHVDDGDVEAAIRAARLARAAGVVVTSDLDKVTDRTPELVAAVSVPIFAAHVPRQLTGVDDDEGALRALARGDGRVLCVTLGARGAMAIDGDTIHAVAGLPVHAVDTTGAGDVFRGGFIYGLLQGWPVPRTLAFANAAAAVSCTRAGAIPGTPALEEIERLLG